MAKGKPAPERSSLKRGPTLAYSKRDKSEKAEAKPETKAQAKLETKPEDAKAEDAKAEDAKAEVPAIEPPPPKGEPWPEATPTPMRPVEPSPAVAEGAAQVAAAAQAPAAGAVEDPTHMPAPREILAGDPTDPALPPGRVPPGDSRSLRRGSEFALVYRVQTAVITRIGTVGMRGVWRVVDYPTSASASNAYAKECSRFVSDGFSDYRD